MLRKCVDSISSRIFLLDLYVCGFSTVFVERVSDYSVCIRAAIGRAYLKRRCPPGKRLTLHQQRKSASTMCLRARRRVNMHREEKIRLTLFMKVKSMWMLLRRHPGEAHRWRNALWRK